MISIFGRVSRHKVVRHGRWLCWEWTGSKLRNGYGGLQINGRHWQAHRYAFTLFFGSIRPGRIIAHRCDNPPCYRPSHLREESLSGNILDSVRKGRYGHAGKRKLIMDTARRIKQAAGTYGEIARDNGVSDSTVADIKKGRTWVDALRKEILRV